VSDCGIVQLIKRNGLDGSIKELSTSELEEEERSITKIA
jgi:hypothetical protein